MKFSKACAPRRPGGYTIIEVMVVLMVSGVLLVSAIVLVGSLQPQTEFTQSVFDIQSRIESEIRGTGNTLFPNVEKYDCSIGGDGRPQLLALPSGTTHKLGTNDACIFLGKAIRVQTGSGNLYFYSVLGRRTYLNNNVTTPVTSLDQANPTTALENNLDINEVYDHDAPSIRLKSATAYSSDADPGQSRTLAGFYTNLSETSGGVSDDSSVSILPIGYNFPSGLTDPNIINSNVRSCIQGGCSPARLAKWNLCFEDLDSKRTALLSIINNASGSTTSLKVYGC